MIAIDTNVLLRYLLMDDSKLRHVLKIVLQRDQLLGLQKLQTFA